MPDWCAMRWSTGANPAAVRLPLPVSLERGVNYRVRMTVQDDHFITYLNGQVISSWTDTVLKRGGVGFFEDQNDPQKVAWVSVSERDSFMGRMLAHFSLFVVPGSKWDRRSCRLSVQAFFSTNSKGIPAASPLTFSSFPDTTPV